jgi:hypothetical protein
VRRGSGPHDEGSRSDILRFLPVKEPSPLNTAAVQLLFAYLVFNDID